MPYRSRIRPADMTPPRSRTPPRSDFRAGSEATEREDLGLRFEEAKNKAAVS